MGCARLSLRNLMAAERLGVAIGEVRLVAAHAWDIAGAARAGCAAAFVARPGKVLDPLVERPEIVGADLAEVADAILAIDHGDQAVQGRGGHGGDLQIGPCSEADPERRGRVIRCLAAPCGRY